jgi:hypothetical protein
MLCIALQIVRATNRRAYVTSSRTSNARNVGHRALQPKSPIGIQSGISDYVGPGNNPEKFQLHRITLLFPRDTNMYGLCPFLVV